MCRKYNASTTQVQRKSLVETFQALSVWSWFLKSRLPASVYLYLYLWPQIHTRPIQGPKRTPQQPKSFAADEKKQRNKSLRLTDNQARFIARGMCAPDHEHCVHISRLCRCTIARSSSSAEAQLEFWRWRLEFQSWKRRCKRRKRRGD